MVIMVWHQNYFVNDCWSVKNPKKFPNSKRSCPSSHVTITHNYHFQISIDPISPMKWITKKLPKIPWIMTIKYCNTEFCTLCIHFFLWPMSQSARQQNLHKKTCLIIKKGICQEHFTCNKKGNKMTVPVF